jgi:predicted metalloendopeptidase
MTQPETTLLHDAVLDTSVRPQDDFFKYVNASWLNAHPIPKSETRWGTFNVLREDAWKAMRDIFETLQAANPEMGSIEQQARDFYYTGMNYDTFEATHLSEIAAIHEKIDAVQNTKQLSNIVGELHAMDIDSLWYTYVDSDHDDSTKHIFHFRQAGLTLPNRDYYLEDSDKMRAVREKYKTHANTLGEFFPLGTSDNAVWQRIIAFETAIATISRSPADLRDVEKNYNKTTLSDLKSTYDAIDWDEYAKGLGWQADDKITVEQPEFMVFMNESFKTMPLDDIKLYLKWRVLNQCLGKISTRFSDIYFNFFGRVLSGTTEIMPQWKRVVLAAENTIGEGTGQLYARKHFPESSKQQVLSLVEYVRTSYDERIDHLDWMSDETKQYAKKKLANMKVLIGYPDVWRDFSGLSITRTSYLANILAGQKLEVTYWLKKLHEPTSRDDWFMTPQTVNAYHDPNRLVICFPAGILQQPFFSPNASLAANMGGIGTVIGHELTHGFDDQGCMFDAEGNVRTWQTEEERAAFNKKAQIIVDQADAFEVLPELTLRGKLVLGESIADLGGIEISLHALKKQLASFGDISEAIAEFFINYAYTECSAVREEKLREYTLTDPHPVSEFRVNGILSHVNEFYEAFDIKEGDKLYLPEDKRAHIW